MIDRLTMHTFLVSALWLLLVADAKTAIVPPPWANPSTNPCAAQPRGWQLLYWPADGKCYKIFQIGAPCPESMELGPAAKGGGVVAECRCPPGTAQSPRDALCHPIFTRASCPIGQYFAPVPESPSNGSGSQRRWGVCREPDACSERGQLFYPRDGKCYNALTRGPCPMGELLILNKKSGLAECSCSSSGELSAYYWSLDGGGCYEHYTKGPCTDAGSIFLPGSRCGCSDDLPHYHVKTKMCYPLGGIGPCPQGHHFMVNSELMKKDVEIHGYCTCKPGHILYKDGLCYRLHTRGPCEHGNMLINSTNCIRIPCRRGTLYFPDEKTCYQIGTKGPCPNGQVVLYDHNVRPSVDGISYNGVCGCKTATKLAGKCTEDINDSCENNPGMFIIDKMCYKLYTQGPCGQGEWLIAKRRPRNEELWQNDESIGAKVKCECRPGYKRTVEQTETIDLQTNSLSPLGECQPPAVGLAQFLNENFKSIFHF